MKSLLSTTGLVVGALLLPVAGYAADSAQDKSKTVTESVKENVGDAVITGKIKTAFAADKLVSAMHINIDTDNKGVVTLRGTAKSQAEVDKAVSIAKSTQGVTAVKSELQIASASSTGGSMAKQDSGSMAKQDGGSMAKQSSGSTVKKDSTASTHNSDQPLDDTGITTRVKSRMATDKLVDAHNISVKTVNGVVELSGTAKSKAEADKAVAIAKQVPHVKSVKNDIQVGGKAVATTTTTTTATPAKHSDQPIDDTMITTKVKAKMAADTTVSATNISVKTVNGVVELTGTAKSKSEADQAVALARGTEHVKSVKSDIQVK